jgi:hypothetical protein
LLVAFSCINGLKSPNSFLVIAKEQKQTEAIKFEDLPSTKIEKKILDPLPTKVSNWLLHHPLTFWPIVIGIFYFDKKYFSLLKRIPDGTLSPSLFNEVIN